MGITVAVRGNEYGPALSMSATTGVGPLMLGGTGTVDIAGGAQTSVGLSFASIVNATYSRLTPPPFTGNKPVTVGYANES